MRMRHASRTIGMRAVRVGLHNKRYWMAPRSSHRSGLQPSESSGSKMKRRGKGEENKKLENKRKTKQNKTSSDSNDWRENNIPLKFHVSRNYSPIFRWTSYVAAEISIKMFSPTLSNDIEKLNSALSLSSSHWTAFRFQYSSSLWKQLYLRR